MINEEFLKTAMPIHTTMNELLSFNLALQASKNPDAIWDGADVAVPYLLSTPGIGKTSMMRDLCMRLNWALITIHAAMKPQEEFGGIPEFASIEIGGKSYRSTAWSLPDVVGQMYQLAENKNVPVVVVFFDDMHLCGSTHLGLMQELFSERSIRGYEVPAKCAFCAAGNTSNKAGARTHSSAITNRMALMNVIPSFEYWKSNFAIGRNTDKLHLSFNPSRLPELANENNSVHPGVISFLEQDLYRQYWIMEEQVDVAWGSNRSWTRFSNWLYAYERANNTIMREDLVMYLATSHVGKEASADFAKYYRIYSKFDMEYIVAHPDEYQLPSSPVDRYALVYALVNYYSNHKDRRSISVPIAKIVLKYCNQYRDLALIIMQNIIDIEKRLKKRQVYSNLSEAMNSLQPDVTYDLIQEISNV